MLTNKKIFVGSIVLGALILVAVVGSLLLLKRPATPTQKNEKESAPTNATPAPTVVTIDALSPEELTRLVLQMWYTRDFGGMYTLLDAELQTKESREAFTTRMEKLPKLESVNIRNAKRTDEKENAVTLTLTIDAKTDAGEIKRDVLFAFKKTDTRWKITTLPPLDPPKFLDSPGSRDTQ